MRKCRAASNRSAVGVARDARGQHPAVHMFGRLRRYSFCFLLLICAQGLAGMFAAVGLPETPGATSGHSHVWSAQEPFLEALRKGSPSAWRFSSRIAALARRPSGRFADFSEIGVHACLCLKLVGRRRCGVHSDWPPGSRAKCYPLGIMRPSPEILGAFCGAEIPFVCKPCSTDQAHTAPFVL